VTHVLAVANQKGGVAKTTTVASLGVALHDLGKRVLLVDLDPQACLTFSLGVDPDTLALSVHEVLLGELPIAEGIVATSDGPSLLPATIDLATTESMLLTRTGREYALRTAIADLPSTLDEHFDHVLIDCPPSLGVLTVNGLTAATDLLIPLQCETLSHRGVGQLLNTVKDIQRMTNPGLQVLGVLPTLYDARTLHSRDVLDDVTDRYGLPVLDPPIGRSVRFAEAPAAGRSVLATAGRTKGVQAYRRHAEFLAARAG
jgi:chromosome partitioning protein